MYYSIAGHPSYPGQQGQGGGALRRRVRKIGHMDSGELHTGARR